MTKEEAIKLLRGGADGVREWNRFRETGEAIPDLTGAALSEANLTEANLRGADLTGANLIGAELLKANLAQAELTQVAQLRASIGLFDSAKAVFRQKF